MDGIKLKRNGLKDAVNVRARGISDALAGQDERKIGQEILHSICNQRRHMYAPGHLSGRKRSPGSEPIPIIAQRMGTSAEQEKKKYIYICKTLMKREEKKIHIWYYMHP